MVVVVAADQEPPTVMAPQALAEQVVVALAGILASLELLAQPIPVEVVVVVVLAHHSLLVNQALVDQDLLLFDT
jgi:hypothetical protein